MRLGHFAFDLTGDSRPFTAAVELFCLVCDTRKDVARPIRLALKWMVFVRLAVFGNCGKAFYLLVMFKKRCLHIASDEDSRAFTECD